MEGKSDTVRTAYGDRWGLIMTNEDAQEICFTCILALLPSAMLGLVMIGERFYAALFNFWKFYGYGGDKGIDIGATAFFISASLCVIGFCACILIIFYLKKTDRKWLYRSAIAASVIYFVNSLMLFSLIASGLAFIHYGR